MLSKSLAVIAASAETGGKGDFSDALGCAQQKVDAFIEPVGYKVLAGRLGQMAFKKA